MHHNVQLLLNSPQSLAPLVQDLIAKLVLYRKKEAGATSIPASHAVLSELYDPKYNLTVVSSRQASNFAYEISRQLGATSVVCDKQDASFALDGRFSFDATVLFALGKFDPCEFSRIISCVSNPLRWLPFVLALDTDCSSYSGGPRGAEEFKVISSFGDSYAG